MSFTPPVHADDRPPRRRRHAVGALRGLWRLGAASLLAIAGLLLAAWLALHWAILPHIEHWRPWLESRATQVLGAPVRIGRIEVRSSGWVPALSLRDVSVLDAQGRPALRLPAVSATLSPHSLLTLTPRLRQLVLDGARLEVRRDPQGRLFVGGLPIGAGGPGEDSAVADWFFSQHEFAVRGGTLRYTDEQRGAPPLVLRDVDLVVRNGLRRHALRLDATPPPGWGQRFSLRGRFTQALLAPPGQWQRWSGTAYAELPGADAGALGTYVALPVDVIEGNGALRAWIELRDGQPTAATLDVALRSVALRLAADAPPLALRQVQGRLSARRDDTALTLAATQLGFVTEHGVDWPRGDLSLTLDEAPRAGGGRWDFEQATAHGGALVAGRLDLGVLAQAAGRIPLGAPLRRLLGELRPQGIAHDVSLRWDGPLESPSDYRASARLEGLSLRAGPAARGIGRPGLRNVDLALDATAAGGSARLHVRDGALEFPGVFEEPAVPLRELDADLAWQVARTPGAPPALSLQVAHARFANADAQGELQARWSSGPGEGSGRGARWPGRLQMDGTLSRGNPARAARYLPLELPASARHYVRDAVRGGRIAAATFRVRGDLWDFPFHDHARAPDGEFRITARVEGATLDAVPDSRWPAFDQVAGELVFDRTAMSIRGAQGRWHGVALSGVQGGIADLDSDRPVLALQGQARGPLADGLRFVHETPVHDWIGPALEQASASGPGELSLALSIPLDDTTPAEVRGSLALAGNDVRLRPDTPLLGDARGRIEFSHEGFTLRDASAQVAGGRLRFTGGQQADGSLRFTGDGTLSAEGLRATPELGLPAPLLQHLHGSADYRIALDIVDGAPQVTITSELVGLASTLPAPLDKAASAPLPLRFEHTPTAGTPAGDELRLALGTTLQARYQRDLSGRSPRVLRGAVGINQAPPALPAHGVAGAATLASLDLDAWRAFAAAPPPAGVPSAGVPQAPGAPDDYLPTTIALQTQDLVAASRHMGPLSAGLSYADGLWRAQLQAPRIQGDAEYRPGSPTGRLRARLARLVLPPGESDAMSTLLEQPASLPALDLVVDDFELNGRRLGRLEAVAVHRGSANRREWRLSRLVLATPEATLDATGTWRAASGTTPRRTELDFRLDLADSGALLQRLLDQRAIRGGRGHLAGSVSWLGSPLALDTPSLGGDIEVAIDAGQFLKVEPGAARLLGVLNLQALPRRLALDFRDVFQQGFAFDSITGDVRIADGVARTNNLRMRGVQAAVLLDGSADIGQETQDLRVVVVPEINAGTAALAYAAINPAVGIGAFLAQLALRKPMIQANTREFHISGPWADPQVERVPRKPGAPLPGEAASAASAGGAAAPATPSSATPGAPP